jgi:glucokinase
MYLGLEIGGTKLQLAVGPGDGTLRAVLRLPARPDGGAEAIRRQIAEAVPGFLHEAELQPHELHGVGIGFGGPVDDATRRVLKSHQVAGWADFPLAAWAEEQFGVPVVLGNDADVAGLAETLFGAGRGLSPVFYTNVGSGIGGALIINGEIYRGCGKGAGEIGHLWSAYDVDHFQRKAWRVVEDCSSGWAMTREAGLANAAAVAEAAMARDARAKAIIDQARRRYAIALSHVIALFCPRRIVLGGGVSTNLDQSLWLSPLRDEIRAIAFPPFAECFDIMPAELGEAVVVHGALALAQSKLGGGKRII